LFIEIKNPGPEDQALVGPWKGLSAIAGVETENSAARSQNIRIALRAYTFYIFRLS
jgi:hypothetical protein